MSASNDKEGQEYYQLVHIPVAAGKIVLEANLSIPKNARSGHICSWKWEQQT
jgi:hypothetical protein